MLCKALTTKLQPASETPARATRLPEDWGPSPADLAFADLQGFSLQDTARIAEQFADYWHAAAGARARKASWPACWRVWLRREAEFRARHRTGGGLHAGMAAALRYGGRP